MGRGIHLSADVNAGVRVRRHAYLCIGAERTGEAVAPNADEMVSRASLVIARISEVRTIPGARSPLFGNTQTSRDNGAEWATAA